MKFLFSRLFRRVVQPEETALNQRLVQDAQSCIATTRALIPAVQSENETPRAFDLALLLAKKPYSVTAEN